MAGDVRERVTQPGLAGRLLSQPLARLAAHGPDRPDDGRTDRDSSRRCGRRSTSSTPRFLSPTCGTETDWVSANAAQPRLNAVLLGIFSSVALIIAAVGVYGILAYSVTQRTREIGLRMALGASRGGVLRLVVQEGMTVGVAGIVAGVAGALGLGRAMASLCVRRARPRSGDVRDCRRHPRGRRLGGVRRSCGACRARRSSGGAQGRLDGCSWVDARVCECANMWLSV